MCSGMNGECRDRRGTALRFKAATPMHTLGVLAPPLPPGVVARPPPPPGGAGNVGGVADSVNDVVNIDITSAKSKKPAASTFAAMCTFATSGSAPVFCH